MAIFDEIGWEPGEIEIGAIALVSGLDEHLAPKIVA
jgi:hypothetical protein